MNKRLKRADTVCTETSMIVSLFLFTCAMYYSCLMTLKEVLEGGGLPIMMVEAILVLLMPILLVFTYRNNLLKFVDDGLIFEQHHYSIDRYGFAVQRHDLPFKERSIFFLWQRYAWHLHIINKTDHAVQYRVELNVFRWQLKRIQQAIEAYQ